MNNLIPAKRIESKIFPLRGQKVMIDHDLAKLYEVKTKALIQAVKRNTYRFPSDFMFQLNKQEVEILRSQIVTSSWGGRRYLPYVFTEQGIAMLSSVLNSKHAIIINIAIMRAFVKIRKMISTNQELALMIKNLERRVGDHDNQILALFKQINKLLEPPPDPPKKRIGFMVEDD